jgi:nitrilase
VIVSPFGKAVAGPLFGEEGILYADLDMAEVVKAKLDFDVVGHYARPDVFQLSVNESPAPSVITNAGPSDRDRSGDKGDSRT